MQKQITAIHGDSIKPEPRSSHREGPILFKRYGINSGVKGLNLEFIEAHIKPGFHTPRHRHNHDQIRYGLRGDSSLGPNNDLKEGECGYFCEGVYYGPQDQKEEAVTVALQFPGSSGSYYMNIDELAQTTEKLRARGATFEKGVYRETDSSGRLIQKDGYEGVWEEYVGQKLEYATPRYPEPVIMRPQAFNWIPVEGHEGIEVKHLGTFTELRTGIALVRWDAGVRVNSDVIDEPEIRYVLKGSVNYNGTDYPASSCFFVPSYTPTAAFSTTTGAEFFVISLPLISYFAQREAETADAKAVS